MGWEERAGRRVYYRKRRQGARVVSEYMGDGALGELAARVDARRLELRQERRRQLQDWRAREAALDKELDQLGELAAEIAAGALLASGCHTHHGTWRKTRGR